MHLKSLFLVLAILGVVIPGEASLIFVDLDASGTEDGTSWPDAFTDLQDALAEAQPGDTIWIAEGIYYPTDDGSRPTSFQIPGEVALYGGFAGIESVLSERNWLNFPVVLSGDIGIPGEETDNSLRVVRITDVSGVTLDGITISHAFNNATVPLLENQLAGGILATNASFSLYNITIINNEARYGGAIGLLESSSLQAVNCQFEKNVSNGLNNKCGGAIYADTNADEAFYTNCFFLENRATFAGGSGGACTGGTNTFVNCIFSQNDAKLGMALSFMNATIYQCTFWRQSGGNGIFSDGNYNLYNSITWNNTSPDITAGSGIATFEDCLIGIIDCPDGSTCSGNMLYNTPPYFVHPYGGDFRLSLCSPAINMGNNDNIPDGIVIDAAGLDRIIGTTVDLGAHEMLDLEPQFRPTDVTNTDSTYANRSWLAALACANRHAGADTIRFLLGSGNHAIQPLYEGPILTDDSTVIDATAGYQLGEIVIDGIQDNYTDFQVTFADSEGIHSRSNNTEVYGMEFRNFGDRGIYLDTGADHSTIGIPGKGNIFFNNGVNISLKGKDILVQSNYVGTTPDGGVQDDLYGGIAIVPGSEDIQIGGKRSLNEGNIIGYSLSAVSLGFSNNGTLAQKNVRISGNHIGLDPNNGNICPNFDGLAGVVNSSSYYMDVLFGGTLDEGNILAHCQDDAIVVLGTGTRVAFRKNIFICNRYGIDLVGLTQGNNGNFNIMPPTVSEADIFHLAGTAFPGDTIEVYINETQDCPDTAACNQGRFFFGERTVDDNGEWEILAADFPFPLYGGEQVTATRTNQYPITSEFSPCVEVVCPESFSSFTTTICPTDSVVVNGTTYNLAHPSGTEVLVDASAIGCDSLIEVNLNFLEEPASTLDTLICESASLQIGNSIFDLNNPNGIARLEGAAANGCDSLVQVNLDFILNAENYLFDQICQGDTLIFNGEELTEAGAYVYLLPAANGCDSILTLELEVLPNSDTQLVNTICEGDSLSFNGQILTDAGIYNATLSNTNGCDSLVQLNLSVEPTQQTSFSASFCEGDIYEFCGNNYTEPGQYECLLTSSNGCDSIVVLQLALSDASATALDTILCEGEALQVGGSIFDQMGQYEVLLTNAAGCDSLINLGLDYNFITSPTATIEPDLGFGDGSIQLELPDSNLSVSWEDGSQDLLREQLFAGEYLLTLTDSLGCSRELSFEVEEGDLIVAMPNIFTPNGDGVNDFFNVVSNSESVNVLQFSIYNRWGQQVYNNETPNTGWDGNFKGKPQPTETYFFYIEVDSGREGRENEVFQGNFTLVR